MANTVRESIENAMAKVPEGARVESSRKDTAPQVVVDLYGEKVPVPETVEEYAEYDKKFNPDIDEVEHQELIDEGVISIGIPDLEVTEEKRSDGNWQLLLPGMSSNTSEW